MRINAQTSKRELPKEATASSLCSPYPISDNPDLIQPMRVILARYDIYDFIGIPSRYDRNKQGGKAKYFPFFVFSSIVLTCVLFWLLASYTPRLPSIPINLIKTSSPRGSSLLDWVDLHHLYLSTVILHLISNQRYPISMSKG